MIAKQKRAESQLFTLRVWKEEMGNGCFEFRGTLKHIVSGETYHFRGWPALTQQIETFLIDEK